MKRSLFLLLVAMMVACGTKPQATITGTVKGVADGTEVYLLAENGDTLDSTVVSDGKFRFELAEAYPDLRLLRLGEDGRPMGFFVEPGIITADVDLNSRSGAVFSGTPTNDGLNAIRERMAGGGDVENIIGSTVRENPNTVLAAYLVGVGAHTLTSTAQFDSVLGIIAGAPANAFTDRLKERRDLLVTTQEGQPAPDFTQNRPDGTPFTLSSLRGKLVLIDFWASWCGPCRAENPNVVKVYNKFKDSGFEIVGVSLDESRQDWLGAIENDGLGWIHVSDLKGWQNAVGRQYGVFSIPHTVLVGPDGTIITKNLRGEALEAKIAEILGTKN